MSDPDKDAFEDAFNRRCHPCQIRSQHPTTGRTNANCWHCKVNELARGPEAHQAFSTGKVDRLWKATQRVFPAPMWNFARDEVRRYWGKGGKIDGASAARQR